MKSVVIFTGAGVSAESGIRTFRDSGGLWEEYSIEEVATPDAWRRNRALVLEFYNQRRRQVIASEPNPAHLAIARMEKDFRVQVITQNIDDLHERVGSTDILHLHGEIRKSRSTDDPRLVYEIEGAELNEGDRCEKGSQLRPHIVWFGEAVPAMDEAVRITQGAEIFIVVGTSLEVYPAASLVHYAPEGSLKFLVDPSANQPAGIHDFTMIRQNAGIGIPALVNQLIEQYA